MRERKVGGEKVIKAETASFLHCATRIHVHVY